MTSFYRTLLALYPASFRTEYRDEMIADTMARRALVSGVASVLLFWAATAVDTLRNALLEHIELLRQDLRYTIRQLRRMPGFAITAVAVIALGIGANTAAFSVADFVFVRPLPFAHADRLVTVWEHPPSYAMMQPSPATFRDWKASATVFDGIGAYHNDAATLTGSGAPQQLLGAAVTGQLFSLLGVRPARGVLFSRADEAEGRAVIVLSDALWRDTFGADPAIVGRTVVLDGAPQVVVGVMPPQFSFPDRHVAYWVPMSAAALSDTDRNNNWFYAVGRLKPGVTQAQAQYDMDRVALQIARAYPTEDGQTGATVLSLRESQSTGSTAQTRILLLALCGAALCVLLISCANLANLLLVRALGRRRELAVRAALGAGRERLVRQLITESLLLAVAGGVLGVALAAMAMPVLSRLVLDSMPLARVPTVDLRVLAGAALLTLATGVGFGVWPAVRAGRAGMFDALRDGARAGGGRRAHLRSALVITEVMMSVILLVSAGLLLRAMWRVQRIDPGFDKSNVLTMRTTLPSYRYWSVTRRTAYYDRVLAQVRAIPGVQSAGFTSFLPMTMGGGIWPATVAGQANQRASDRTASLRYITPGYLATMRIPVTHGRDVGPGDTPTAPYTALVSDSFAARIWPGIDPLGRHFNFALHDRVVVGVTREIKVRGPERSNEPQVYVPYQQVSDSQLTFYAPKDLAIRSALPAATLVPLVRRIVAAADAELPISDVQSLEEIVDAHSAGRLVQVRILTAFAAVALLLAAVGLHGLLAFAVTQRRREIGIRLALGARRMQIIGLVVSQGVTLAIAGLVPGVLIAYAAGRGMASVLVGVQPNDLATIGTVAGGIFAVVAAGSWLPGLRASRVEPHSVLQAE